MSIFGDLFKRKKKETIAKEINYLEFLETMFMALPVKFNSKAFIKSMERCELICSETIEELTKKPRTKQKTQFAFEHIKSIPIANKEVEYMNFIEQIVSALPNKNDTDIFIQAIENLKNECSRTKSKLSLKATMLRINNEIEVNNQEENNTTNTK